MDDEILRSRLRTDFHVTSGRRPPCRRRGCLSSLIAHLHDDVTRAKSSGSCSQIRAMLWIAMALKDNNIVDKAKNPPVREIGPVV